ncbi:N-acetylmuramoyl-L-alanine amidase [Clostridium sp.]|uniref:N-acetylmuramoyl-L-alanine amidase family protein n=1 Tax=Clostridium sp. TaxID=1506 RepID=UPI001A378A29|nr:N-acetylmuramoyl-L-alanine amidase [Clostridium sp.]MBK5234061.1 N-acetylmuramoyl-L-alanine amidase [Clostridium sp.]
MIKIAISAGHGLTTAGKRTIQTPTTHEWEMNSKIATNLENLLAQFSEVKALRFDDPTGAIDIPYQDRIEAAVIWEADLFIDIHNNAGGGSGSEVYTPVNGTMDTWGTELVRKMSEYSGLPNRGLKHKTLDSGKDHYYTIRFAVAHNIESVLCECGFMDTWSDLEVITTPKGQAAFALAIFDSLVEKFNLKGGVEQNLKEGLNTIKASGTDLKLVINKEDEVIDTMPLSWKEVATIDTFLGDGVVAAINANNFVNKPLLNAYGQILGRYQSQIKQVDQKNDADGLIDVVVDKTDQVLTKDYMSWDLYLANIKCGMSCTYCIVDKGENVHYESTSNPNGIDVKNNQTFMVKFKDGKFGIGVSTGDLYSIEVKNALNIYNGGIEHLSFYDRGDSTQLVMLDNDGNIIKVVYTGRKLPMTIILRKMTELELAAKTDKEPESPIVGNGESNDQDCTSSASQDEENEGELQADEYPYKVKFKVNLGSFRFEKNAIDYADLMKRKGIAAYVHFEGKKL